jgi:uncharacterized protein (DUF305 family)
MNRIHARFARISAIFAAAFWLAACAGSPASTGAPATPGNADGPRIVQPGAPGEAATTYATGELGEVEGVSYTAADVRFLQGMIPHHAQALEMTALVRRHATTDAVRQMALRMEISQRDEIALMESWLREHGEPVEMPGMGGMGHMHLMPGMLTPEQMEELGDARGVEFDRLFLEYMIQHHRGAVDMVRELFSTSGAGQESTIFKFAEDVDADQTMEIARMQSILNDLR